ncbi:uncharacterized protein VP01_2325g1 [Puccinia sorghi]|uniref:Uncharacterized protein n=1 Tax=Puccinia sorghi TaxID=27349 RepID=A0A0L6V891_9BASI|nr:uncharacterized protein VP01_2325g1 [Puccinia sorghi]
MILLVSLSQSLIGGTSGPGLSQCSSPKLLKYSIEHGLLFHGHRIVVLWDLALRREIICSHHNSKLAGHRGCAKNLSLLNAVERKTVPVGN